MNKYIIGAVVVIGIFAGGFYLGKGQKQIDIQEKIVTREGETRTVYKDRIVTVTKVVRPDGTTEETTRTEEKEGKKEEKIAENRKEKDNVTRSIASSYSLGLKYWADMSDSIDVSRVRKQENYEVTAGYRIIGDVWLQAGAKLDKQLSLGVSLQF